MFTNYAPAAPPTFDSLADIRTVLQTTPWPVQNVQGYGALGDGVHDDRAAILAAEAALGAAGGAVFLPPGTYRLAASTTLRATTILLSFGGATLAPAAATTLTVLGAVRAGQDRLFSGSGTVTLSQPQTIYPEWWGAAADVQTSVAGASITSGQTALTLSWASLTAADVGKALVVVGAGAAGAPLVTTIAAVTSATTATAGLAASTTVSGGKAAYGTDSTAAIQAALDQVQTARHRIVLTGRYGATKLQLWPYTRLEGLAQMDFSGVYRMGVGIGGPFVALAGAAISAQGLALENLYFDAMQMGTTLGGVDLGTDAHARALASGGYLRNVKVKNALGWAFDVRCNVASFHNLWAQHDVALPAGNTTAGGMRFSDTLAYGWQLNVEGPYPAGAFSLGAGGGSVFEGLQMELSGVYATTDVVTFSANQQLVNGLYVTLGTHRDLVKIPTAVQDVVVNLITINSTHTLTNVVNDVDRAYTIAGTGLVSSYAGYSTYTTATDAGGWTPFTPTWTGFSVNPTVTSRYKKVGRLVTWSVDLTGSGTSNATTLTATLPVTAQGARGGAAFGIGVDNGAAAGPVRLDITGSPATVATFYKDALATAWTNVGGKGVRFTLVYESLA
jgi:hypothetical protein